LELAVVADGGPFASNALVAGLATYPSDALQPAAALTGAATHDQWVWCWSARRSVVTIPTF